MPSKIMSSSQLHPAWQRDQQDFSGGFARSKITPPQSERGTVRPVNGTEGGPDDTLSHAAEPAEKIGTALPLSACAKMV